MKNKKIKFNQINKIQIILGLFILVFFTFSCEKDEYPTPIAVNVVTASVSSVTGSSAISGGALSQDDDVTSRGICWDTIIDPAFGKLFSYDTLGLADFTSKISGLKGGTTYYVRAFATNNGGIYYGQNETFTTNVVPFITTTAVTEITGATATSGGIITNSFGAQIVEKGVCWSLTENPSILDSKTVDGTGTEPFISQITGLSPNLTYHVRAFATTSDGDTGYGDDLIFDTEIQDYDGNVYTSVKIGEAVWLAQNFISTHFSDGTPIESYAWHADDVNHEYGISYLGSDMLKPEFGIKGWHVPTKDEWDVLFETVGQDAKKLKEPGTDHWNTDNGTNETGFTALGASHIYGTPLKGDATWWSSTVDDNGIPWRYVIADDASIWFGPWNGPEFAFTVRLVKD